MMSKLIVHVSEVDLTEESGMGRVGWHWQRAFEQQGYEFIHIGPSIVGKVRHPGLFPAAAYRAYQQLHRQPAVLLVHEPASGAFLKANVPMGLVSHGIERRDWEMMLNGEKLGRPKVRRRTRWLFPWWRLRNCDRGLRQANFLLLLNQEDSTYAQRHYGRSPDQIYVFKNGIYPTDLTEKMGQALQGDLTILFLGSWIERKGIRVLTQAADLLHQQGITLRWLLAGTGAMEPAHILQDWPAAVRPWVEIIPRFKLAEESSLFARSQLFVLPSFFEGQPLSLLQAMASGQCCIASNCCGQRDLIQPGKNGLLHESGNAEQLAGAIVQCIKDPLLREKLGHQARMSVDDRSWQAVSAQVVQQVETLLSL